MDIKELLGDIENAEAIAESINKEIAKGYMPRAKFNEVNEELKATKEQLDNTNSKIEELSKNSTVTDELKQQLEATQKEYETFKSEATTRELNLQKTQALKDGLRNKRANQEAIDLLIPTFDLESIQLDKSGNIVDADDIFNPIMETRASLFSKETTEGAEIKQSTSKVDTSTLSDTEYFKQKMSQYQK